MFFGDVFAFIPYAIGVPPSIERPPVVHGTGFYYYQRQSRAGEEGEEGEENKLNADYDKDAG